MQDALDIKFQIGCLGADDIYLIQSYCCFKLKLFDRCIEMLGKSEENLKKDENSMIFAEEDEKKLLAIKVNTILVNMIRKSFDLASEMCQNLINDVY